MLDPSSNDFDEANFDDWNFSEPDFLQSLESLIKSSNDYVIPSDDLRPKIAEAARENSERRRDQMTLLGSSVIVLGLALLLMVVGQVVSKSVGKANWDTSFQTQAERRASAAGVDLDWSFGEIVRDFPMPPQSGGR